MERDGEGWRGMERDGRGMGEGWRAMERRGGSDTSLDVGGDHTTTKTGTVVSSVIYW